MIPELIRKGALLPTLARTITRFGDTPSLGQIGKTTIPYPTRGKYVKRLADTYNRTRITPAANRLIKTWFRFIS